MPDWSYRTVFRPLLFRLPPNAATRMALGFMGRLGRLPGGKQIISLMGHMAPDQRLRYDHSQAPSTCRDFPSRVGLAAGLDYSVNASGALSQFGFGMQEVGPVGVVSSPEPAWSRTEQSLRYSHQPVISGDEAIKRLRDIPRPKHPRASQPQAWLRLADNAEADALALLRHVAPESATWRVDAVVAPGSWKLETLRQLATMGPPLWLVVPGAAPGSEPTDQVGEIVDKYEDFIAGWIIGAPKQEDAWELGASQLQPAIQMTRRLRKRTDKTIVQAAGIHSADDAIASLAAGADMVQVNSGLMFSGPGLPKRINDAVLHLLTQQPTALRSTPPAPAATPHRPTQMAWLWALLMGLGLFGGGLLAVAIACTAVVLPYDESMSGLTRAQLGEINPRLLSFMTHDRVTLAGTMLSVGAIYATLAWFGIRRGVHWASVAIVASSLTGFFTFFSFLGFGYFDPFHAFVSALLFQMLLLIMHSDLTARCEPEAPELRDSQRWRQSQWGQLLFVIHGAILMVAGTVITKVGMTDVFVREDLEFMQTDLDCFVPYPGLTPLIAHDRATFGGMLLACGVVVLLSALWGFRRGQAWLWWALFAGGNTAYWCTLIVHWAVGYNSLKHLLPAYAGLALLWTGGLLSLPYLVWRDPHLENRWQDWLQVFAGHQDAVSVDPPEVPS